MTTSRFRLGTALVVGLALALRLIYQMGTEPLVHIAGDINAYVHYAWNLGQHGVYSSAPINPDVVPLPDSFRPPGYPLFLLAAMWLGGFDSAWIKVAYILQIVLSSATVLLTILLGREWMKAPYALAAGVLLAIWPHHIVFASTLLSETLLGFFVALALWLTAVAERRSSNRIAAAAGLAFGYAALINTVVLLFPLVVVVVMLTTARRKQALSLLVAFALLPIGWSALGPAHQTDGPSNAGRAGMNFIQGSWPDYHAAWKAREHSDVAKQIMGAIDSEIELLNRDPSAGLSAVKERMALEPSSYIRWYLLEKPYFLWDWDIQLGWGGPHFLPVESTPFERQPIFRLAMTVTRVLVPAIFLMGAIASFVLAILWLTRRRPSFAAVITALFCIYVTAVHVVLQAEPRYSIPYRPEQILMACIALQGVVDQLLRRKTENSQ